MKTTVKTTLITAAIAIAITGPLAASPRGKHAVDTANHDHVANGTSTTTTHVEKNLLKRVGPPGKGYIRYTNTGGR